jgi:hypothetical protein
MSRYHACITGKDLAALAVLVRKHKVTVARHTVEKVAGGYRVDAHATDAQIKALEAAGYQVERLEDAEAQGKARQAETRARMAQPQALGALSVAAGSGYLDVDQVEAALAAASGAPNDAITKLIKLPHAT